MSRSVLFHPAARVDLRAAFAEYEAVRPGLGAALARELRDLLELAQSFPSMGSPHQVRGVRRLFTRTFPYALVYLVTDDALYIVAVAHGRRAPDYWRDRIP